MKFNWQNYKLKVKGEYLAADITVELVDYKRKSNNFIDEAIEEVWRDTEKGRKSVGLELWDSTIYSLDSLQVSEKRIQLKIGESTYIRNYRELMLLIGFLAIFMEEGF